MERYPNLKEEVGGSNLACEISSLPDGKLAKRSTASCALALAYQPSVSKKKKNSTVAITKLFNPVWACSELHESEIKYNMSAAFWSHQVNGFHVISVSRNPNCRDLWQLGRILPITEASDLASQPTCMHILNPLASNECQITTKSPSKKQKAKPARLFYNMSIF